VNSYQVFILPSAERDIDFSTSAMARDRLWAGPDPPNNQKYD